MKPHILSLALILTGCASITYSPLVGEQPECIMAPSAFVNTLKGIPVYHGYPNVPYAVMGQFEIVGDADAANTQLVWLVKKHGADAVIFGTKETQHAGSVNMHFTSHNPHYTSGTSYAMPVEDVALTGKLIKFTGPKPNLTPSVQTSTPKEKP